MSNPSRHYDHNANVHRWLRVYHKGGYLRGDDVTRLQKRINLLGSGEYAWASVPRVGVDGEFGPATLKAGRKLAEAMGLVLYKPGLTESTQKVLYDKQPRTKAQIARSEKRRAAQPLSERAYRQAQALVGVMEVGGNNTGPMVTKIIRANSGTGPEPWCGDFVAYCYRLAGSKAVDRSWASVALLGSVIGVSRTSSPRRGDPVRFTFDHVGLFVKDNGNGTITTIEGNTGASGTGSDSTTGGDGVYEKIRSKGLVRDYLRVSR